MCGHTRKDRVRNDDIRDRAGVAPIEEKLVQHRLRWFEHIQRRPPEAPVHSGRLKRAENVKKGRGRPNLTWEESVKRDLRDWSLEYHQRTRHGQGCMEACYPCARTMSWLRDFMDCLGLKALLLLLHFHFHTHWKFFIYISNNFYTHI